MDKFVIKGPSTLSGEVEVSLAKNAVLPIMAATLLADGPITLTNIPSYQDVLFFKRILESLGVKIKDSNGDFLFDPRDVNNLNADYDLVRKMRASFLVLGPLLTKYGNVSVSLPGGCAIGSRPIDLHLMGLEKLGAKIQLESGYVKATTDGLVGADIHLPFPSVGATENLVMAATMARGETTISNCAKEPEVVDMCNFLVHLGYDVTGQGTSTIKIVGKKSLTKTEHSSYQCIGDRIEAATLILAGLVTKSEITIKGFNPNHLAFVLEVLKSSGANFKLTDNSITVLKHNGLTPFNITTAPYPGFPTDVQAQMMSLAIAIDGASTIKETIFENRFMHVPELQRLGASVHLSGSVATINGGIPLKCAPVMCTDLRASAALVLSSLCAQGDTSVNRVYHLDRGYLNLENKLSGLGVNIQRMKE